MSECLQSIESFSIQKIPLSRVECACYEYVAISGLSGHQGWTQNLREILSNRYKIHIESSIPSNTYLLDFSHPTRIVKDLYYSPDHPIKPLVNTLLDAIFSFLAISSSTSQLDQMNFPFKNSASGLADQTMKEAASSTVESLAILPR